MSASLNISRAWNFLRWLIPAILWGGFITIMSGVPGGTIKVKNFWDLITFDKFGHVAFYAVFSYLLAVGIYKQHTFKAIRYHGRIYVLCISVLFGILQEIFQLLQNDGRSAEFADVIANTAGALAGVAIFNLIFGKVLKETK
ncbi:MAG: VanZ family protein [Bacteroidia bacterium]